jgi:hypothetical protein
MRKSSIVFLVFLLGLFSIAASNTGDMMPGIKYSPLKVKVKKADVQSSANVMRDPDYGKIPLYFIPNQGQVNEKAKFYAKTSRYTLWMTAEGLVFDSVNPFQSSWAGESDASVSKLSFSGCAPVLWVNKNILNFAVNSLGHTTNPQNFLIRNVGGGTLDWEVIENSPWIKCNPTSGTNFGVVEVSLDDLDGLKIGSNVVEIFVRDPNANNSPQMISAVIWLYTPGSPPETDKPFGYFETPEDNTIVSGSVPFTGWALDDLEVVSVKIYLEVGTSLVYIGDALFVEGARPDVFQVYPDYPHSNRAGWGYLILTNALPDGLHVFHAIVTDIEGNQVTLGTKTIIINNADAVKPFGTIDDPDPGEPVSGSYRVQGWALTPLPKTIPQDGIDVVVDGLDLGEANYGIPRNDVCNLFPGYNNCPGPGFYFDMDTIEYSNGMHTIYCHVDDGEKSADIGCRYFNIWNLGSKNSKSQTSSQNHYSLSEIIKMPFNDLKPIEFQRGYNEAIEPQFTYPDENGKIYIETRELERIKVQLNAAQNAPFNTSNYTGYHVIGSQLFPLPIGSTLDAKEGIFYWQPGPGFVGIYQLVFIREALTGQMSKKLITVKILPKFTGKAH